MASRGPKKLSEHQIGEIFECRNHGMTQTAIAARFRVSQKNISNILLRRVWKVAGGSRTLSFGGPALPRGEGHWKSVLSEKDVRDMRKFNDEGVSIGELSRRYHMHRSSVGFAVRRKTWRHVV